MHFWRGICILFWCDYVVLYMVGTLNAFSARYSYTFFGVITLCCIWLALSMHFWRGICILFFVRLIGTDMNYIILTSMCH